MTDLPSMSVANFIIDILAKIPKLQQWSYKPTMQIKHITHMIDKDAGNARYGGFTVTNSGLGAAIIVEA